MNIFRRPEFWILLLLLGGVIAFVLSSQDGNRADDTPGASEAAPPPAPPESAVSSSPYAIEESRLLRDFGNAVLEIHLDVDNRENETALELSSPTARLLGGPGADSGGSGEEIPAFFLAFAEVPTVPPGGRETVVLKYWLESGHLESPLWLHVEETALPVKNRAPFELESIPNQESASFTTPDWSPHP
ncbi:MAG: hypothetical protein ACC661_05195 [Verrucomicrobiales bacterium]